MVKKFNISKPKKYTKNGVEKTYWNNIGTMTEFTKEDGSVSRLIEIPAIGLDAQVFPAEPRVTPENNGIVYPENPAGQPVPESEVNTEDIPF